MTDAAADGKCGSRGRLARRSVALLVLLAALSSQGLCQARSHSTRPSHSFGVLAEAFYAYDLSPASLVPQSARSADLRTAGACPAALETNGSGLKSCARSGAAERMSLGMAYRGTGLARGADVARYDARQLLRVSHVVYATNTPADVDELLDSLPKGDSKGGRVRVVGSDTELGEKWDDLTRGGTPGEWKNYDGEVVRRPDGTEVGLRPGWRSGGRTIDIRTPGRKDRRIHVK